MEIKGCSLISLSHFIQDHNRNSFYSCLHRNNLNEMFLYIYVLDNYYFLIFRHTLYLSQFNNKGLGDSAISVGRQLAICMTAPVYFIAIVSRHPRYIVESSVLSSKDRAVKRACHFIHIWLVCIFRMNVWIYSKFLLGTGLYLKGNVVFYNPWFMEPWWNSANAHAYATLIRIFFLKYFRFITSFFQQDSTRSFV